jgi:hypothetical protein
MHRSVVLASVLVLVLAAGGVPAQSTNYEITAISGSIDTPERTVTVEGDTYTVSSVSRVSQGDDLSVTVDAPAGERYGVYLYDSERNIADTKSQVGSGTASLSTNLEPGSYVAATYNEGTIEDVQPVVISGYSVSVDVPSSTTADEAVTATAQLDQTAADSPPEQVLITVWNDGSRREVTATQTSDGTYEASLDGLSAGEYEVYATAHGPEVVNGEQELLGMSDPQSLTVTEASTATTTSNGGGGDTGGGGDDSDTETPETETTTTTTSSTPTTTQSVTPTNTPTPTGTVTTTPTSLTTVTDSPTPTTSDVITPGSSTTTSTTVPDPGPQIVAVLLGLLCLLGLSRR